MASGSKRDKSAIFEVNIFAPTIETIEGKNLTFDEHGMARIEHRKRRTKKTITSVFPKGRWIFGDGVGEKKQCDLHVLVARRRLSTITGTLESNEDGTITITDEKGIVVRVDPAFAEIVSLAEDSKDEEGGSSSSKSSKKGKDSDDKKDRRKSSDSKKKSSDSDKKKKSDKRKSDKSDEW